MALKEILIAIALSNTACCAISAILLFALLKIEDVFQKSMKTRPIHVFILGSCLLSAIFYGISAVIGINKSIESMETEDGMNIFIKWGFIITIFICFVILMVEAAIRIIQPKKQVKQADRILYWIFAGHFIVSGLFSMSVAYYLNKEGGIMERKFTADQTPLFDYVTE